MQLDVVNASNEKVGTVEVNDEVFGGRVNTGLLWESVKREQAAARRGTHATKNRAAVSGSGKKPWRQKGTGRARVGEIRNPLWRKGGTVFGPQPRSYEYAIPKKAERGALRSALTDKLKDGRVVVVDALSAADHKTRTAVALLKGLGVDGKAVLIDVTPDASLLRGVQNLPGVKLVPSMRVTARDVLDAGRVIVTRGAMERLQEALGERRPEARSLKPEAERRR